MPPPKAVVRAAAAWVNLLRTNTFAQASNLIHASARYADLTATQYAAGIDWLRNEQFLTDDGSLSAHLACLDPVATSELLLLVSLTSDPPAWLPDSDVLIEEPSELPLDAAAMAADLGVDEWSAVRTVHAARGLVDATFRKELGSTGEAALVALLESAWPGSCSHVALHADGLGYDVQFRQLAVSYHLEVKTTTRAGRLVIYLSRRECETAVSDARWKLVVVGLDPGGTIGALATLAPSKLLSRLPADTHAGVRWESIRVELSQHDLVAGLDFVDAVGADLPLVLTAGTARAGASFAWMP